MWTSECKPLLAGFAFGLATNAVLLAQIVYYRRRQATAD
jgi:hypothetical protein